MYELTREGMEVLHESAKALKATDEILGVFLSRYSEFVALDHPQAHAARAAADAARRRRRPTSTDGRSRVAARRRRQGRRRASRSSPGRSRALLARRGHRVLALDSDTLPGLSISIGADVPDDAPLNAAAERNEKGRWHLVKGVGPARAVQRYATDAPDGVRLLQIGKTDRRGLAPNRASHNAFYQVVHRPRRRAARSTTG